MPISRPLLNDSESIRYRSIATRHNITANQNNNGRGILLVLEHNQPANSSASRP
jgi:hypothetical protein